MRFWLAEHPRVRRIALRSPAVVVGLVVAVTAASFGYNLVTDGPAPRRSGLLMAHGGGFDTRYRSWGVSGTPIVLVPGAFETADTFAQLGTVLGRSHRVFAIDPQMSASDADATARSIGAPPPTFVPGRHLTMISSPQQVAAAIEALIAS